MKRDHYAPEITTGTDPCDGAYWRNNIVNLRKNSYSIRIILPLFLERQRKIVDAYKSF